MKQNIYLFKNTFLSILRLVFLFLSQILLENLVKHLFGDTTFYMSVSFIFILNLLLFIYLKNSKIFFALQFTSIALIAIVMLPHLYYFNLFSFYSRTNYISYEPMRFILYTFWIFLAAISIYAISSLQIKQLYNLKQKKYAIFGITIFLIFVKLLIGPTKFDVGNRRIAISTINQNQLLYYKLDYISYIDGKNKIENYKCEETNNQSPTIRFMHNTKSKKELLLIVESWGIFKDSQNQKRYIDYIKKLFLENERLRRSFKFNYGETCFHGNTSSAEGRELLNMNNEESYRAFLIYNMLPRFNMVKYKNLNNYYTVAAFSGSKVYGSNWSNAEGFRKKLGFLSRFYFEELKEKNKINSENNYNAVNDEAMIDSLINESVLHQKIFAYGLTINTHTPFNLDKTNINSNDYEKYTQFFVDSFNRKTTESNQLYRIKTIIEHTFKKLDLEKKSFDKVLFVGDHAYPTLNSKNLFNQEKVPYILIEKKID